MKSEKEIRSHRDDLVKLLNQDCECSDPIASLIRLAQLTTLQERIALLNWILDESPDGDFAVERIARKVSGP